MIDLSFPVTMRHPQHAPAVLSTEAVANNYGALAVQHGSPERFPDVTVHDERQEEQARARGYLRVGENLQISNTRLEYPKILCHPDHEEGAGATQASVVGPDGIVRVVPVAARPVKFPDVTVNTREEEEKWTAKGYSPAGHYDEKAYERAIDAPGEPGDEYPRWEEDEDGNPILVHDPNTPIDESRIYPMMIYSKDGKELGVATNAAEKENLLTRGSSKNEPTKRPPIPAPTPADFAEWQEFQAFKQWRAAQATGVTEMVVETTPKADAIETLVHAAEHQQIDDLRQQALELGITVDKRWGPKTLQREIDMALGS